MSGFAGMGILAIIFSLSFSQPNIQQLEDGFFDSLWGVGAWEILAKLLAGQGNVIPFRLFLLHHNLEHGIFVQFPALAHGHPPFFFILSFRQPILNFFYTVETGFLHQKIHKMFLDFCPAVVYNRKS